MENKKTAFVLMPFAREFTDVYTHFISVCLEDAGYDVKRADDINNSRNIIENIIGAIVNSDLIIADLTGGNPNVYYELGIAHTLNKNVILIIQEIDDLPFDLRSYRVIVYSTYFAKMDQAKKELFELASEAFNGKLLFGNPVKDFGNTNPISVNTENQSESQIIGQDYGLFDYQVNLEDDFNKMNDIITNVTDKLNCKLNPEIKKWMEKFKSGNLTSKQRQSLCKEFSASFLAFGEYMKSKNNEYRMLLKNSESSFEYILSGNFNLENKEAELDLQNFIDILPNFENVATKTRESFLTTVSILESKPKLERNFDSAKAFLASEFKTFADNILQTISVLVRAGRLSRILIERAHDKK